MGLVAGLVMVTLFGQAAQSRPDADVLGMVLVGSMFGLSAGGGLAPCPGNPPAGAHPGGDPAA